MVGPQTNLNRYQKTEIVPGVFSGMEGEINYEKETEKHADAWALNNMLPSGSTMRSRKKSKNTLSQMNMKTQ